MPASGEGTSMVALSDSSVMSEVFLLDAVAGLDQHLDDGDVLEIPDVGDLDLDDVAHGLMWLFWLWRLPAALIG